MGNFLLNLPKKLMKFGTKIPGMVYRSVKNKDNGADVGGLETTAFINNILNSFGLEGDTIMETIKQTSLDDVKAVIEDVKSGDLNPTTAINNAIANSLDIPTITPETITAASITESVINETDIGADLSDSSDTNYKGTTLDTTGAGPSSVGSSVTYDHGTPNVASADNNDLGHDNQVRPTGGRNTTGMTEDDLKKGNAAQQGAFSSLQGLWGDQYTSSMESYRTEIDKAKITMDFMRTRSHHRID